MKVGQVGRSGTFGLQGSKFTTMNQSRVHIKVLMSKASTSTEEVMM